MRTERIKNYISSNLFAVEPTYMMGLLETVNAGVAKKQTDNEIESSHSYEAKDGVAIISIDGAMTKKNTWINAMCGNLVPYNAISNYINEALKDDAIHTILFNVDTVGGEVAGADELGEKIRNSNKKTVTFYNNIGASAGIWIFSASDEIYSNKTAMIGSIGVLSGYYDKEEDDGKVVLVSKNAKNKYSKGNNSEKIQSRIDKVESIFFERVERNTGFSSEQIVETFNSGDVISADEAKKAGFIKEITSFDSILSSLVAKAVPTSENRNKSANKFKKDEDMKKISSDEVLASAEYQSLSSEVDGLKQELASEKAEKIALTEKVTALTADMKSFSEKSEDSLLAKKEIVKMALSNGADMEITMKMMDCDSKEKASLTFMESVSSNGSQIIGEDSSLSKDVDDSSSVWSKIK